MDNKCLFVGTLTEVLPDLQIQKSDGTYMVLRRIVVKEDNQSACFIVPQMFDMQNILQHKGKKIKVYFKLYCRKKNGQCFNSLVITNIKQFLPHNKEVERLDFSNGGYVRIEDIIDTDGYLMNY